MPKAVYTTAKGLFESNDSDSGFEISTGVSHQCVAVPKAAVKRIRIFQQKDAVSGDSYAALEQKLITVGSVVFELDTDNADPLEAGGDEEIQLNGLTLATADPHSVADAIATAINQNGSLTGVFAVADTATTDASGTATESTSDYADVTIYAHATGRTFALTSDLDSTHGSIAKIDGPTSPKRTFAGSFYLPAGREEDEAPVQVDADLDVGTLEDGSNVGETVLLLNNSTNRDIKITSSFPGPAASAVLSAASGVLLAWSGSAWATVKSYGTFA